MKICVFGAGAIGGYMAGELVGVFLGISHSNKNQKALKISMFFRRFRFRPREPDKSIAYTILLLIYCAFPV
jgi:hypothetical protein